MIVPASDSIRDADLERFLDLWAEAIAQAVLRRLEEEKQNETEAAEDAA